MTRALRRCGYELNRMEASVGERTFVSSEAQDRIERIRSLAQELDTITVGMVRRECAVARVTAYKYLRHMTERHILRHLQDHTGWVLDEEDHDDELAVRALVASARRQCQRDNLVAALFGPAAH